MNLNTNVPSEARHTIALLNEVQRMGRDPDRKYSDSNISDTLLSGLIDIVANLEIAVDRLNRDAADAKSKADIADMQYRAAGGR